MNKEYKKRILFIGMPDMAIVCLDKLIQNKMNIVAVVPPHRDDSTYDLMVNFSKANNLYVLNYDDNINAGYFIDRIRNLKADIAVVCSYNKKFSEELINSVKDGFINIHPSLLPDYRGGDPYSNVIINREKFTGVTLHFMDKNFDTGDIISQTQVNISNDETMGTLFYKLNRIGADMLFKLLEIYENTNTIPRRKQPEGIFKKAPIIKAGTNSSLINWNKTAEDVESFIRALNPFIGAGSYYKGEYIRINYATVYKKKHNLSPGTIFINSGDLFVACGENYIRIDDLQISGYLICSGKEFVRRINITQGDTFNNG